MRTFETFSVSNPMTLAARYDYIQNDAIDKTTKAAMTKLKKGHCHAVVSAFAKNDPASVQNDKDTVAATAKTLPRINASV